MRAFLPVALVLFAAVGSLPAAAEWIAVHRDTFENGVSHALQGGADLVPGREGQALRLRGQGRLLLNDVTFPPKHGRVQIDVCPTDPITPRTDGKHWMLLTDVGAGGAWPGATVIYFDRDTTVLRYGVFDGGWRWLDAPGVQWTPGVWRRLAFAWGPQGRELELDGKVLARDDYGKGLAPRAMQFGYFDTYSEAAPLLLDGLLIEGEVVETLACDTRVICPQSDGVLDGAELRWNLLADAEAVIDLTKDGKQVARLYGPRATAAGAQTTRFTGGDVPSGDYEVRLTATRPDGTVRTAGAALAVDRELKWQAAPPLARDWFPLGVWYFWELDASYINRLVADEAQAAAYYEQTAADLQKLGVDTVVANWTPRAHRRLLLDAAPRHGLRVIVHLDEVNSFIWSPERFGTDNCVATFREAIAQVRAHPATAGYYLVDEPAPTEANIANIRLCRRLVEALDPAHPGFSCLNTGWDSIFRQVGYQVLLVDIYPLYNAHLTGDTLQGYLKALDAAHAAAAGAPLWVIPQNFGFKPRPESIPHANEVTLLCWEALARGAHGLIHFIYQSTTEIQGERLAGIVDDDLKPRDQRYAETQALHRSLQPLRKVLLGLTRQEHNVAAAPAGFDAQTFKDSAGRLYVMVVNQDLAATRTAELRLAPAAEGKVTDVATGAVAGSGGEARVTLPPGTGALLKL